MSAIDKIIQVAAQNAFENASLNTLTNKTYNVLVGSNRNDISANNISGNDLSFNTVSNNIIPQTNDTYGLGSSSKTWNNVYVGTGSVYVNGKQVITDSSNEMNISTSTNNDLKVKTSGTGDLKLESTGSGNVAIKSTNNLTLDASSNIVLRSTDGGSINLESDLSVSGAIDCSSLTVNGVSITQNGGSGGGSVDLATSSINDLSDVSFTASSTTNGHALIWNSTTGVWEPGAVSSGGGSGTTIDETTDVSLNDLKIHGNLTGDSNISLGSHIIPTTNSTYDLGSAEYKIRHLFLSNNSLWVGDNHKIAITDGKMRFKKVNKSVIPKNIRDIAGTSLEDAKTFLSNSYGRTRNNIEDFTLDDWLKYGKEKGLSEANIDNIFDATEDFDKDGGLAEDLSGSSLNLNTVNATTLVIGDTNVATALSEKAPLASPALTGTPTAPTATVSTNTTQVATTAFVNTAISNLVDSAPDALNTLNELAAALGDDKDFSTTITTQLASKQDTIGIGGLSIANTSGLQTALDSKQATIGIGGLSIANTSGLQTALDSKQATLTAGTNITIAIDGTISASGGGGGGTTINETTDVSLNNLFVHGDISGVDASFNNVELDTINSITSTTLSYLQGVSSSIQTQLDNKTTESYVDTAISNLVDSAPDALNTLNELSAALNDDANFSTTITNQIASKQDTINDGDLSIAKTSGLQTALDAKQLKIVESTDVSLNNLIVHGDISGVDASFNNIELDTINSITSTTLGYLQGVSSSIQTQLDSKTTESYVDTAISNLVDSAPDALNTLNELAAALGDDANFSTTITTTLAGKQDTIADGDLSIAKTSGLQTALDSKQATLTAGTNITIASDGTISASGGSGGGTTINETTDVSLNNLYVHGDISGGDVSFNKIEFSGGTLKGHLIPDVANVYDLGSATHPIRELFLGPSSLYIDGKKVIESNADTINVTTDENQNLTVKTTGTGLLKMESESQGIGIYTTGSGDISLECQGTGNIEINSDVSLTGNIEPNSNNTYVLGSSTKKFNQIWVGSGGVQGQVSSIANHDTDNLEEGSTNLYHTNSRARGAISGGTGVSYDSTSGEVSIGQAVSTSSNVSFNNLTLTGDISGADASFNNVELDTINAISSTTLGYISNVSGDIQSQIDLKASIASPSLTGTPTAPTATASTNTTQIATTAFVNTAISNLVDTAPDALNTLNELAAALGDDANFSTTVTNSLAGKQNTIADGDLSIAKTDGLQTALDAKQATIADGDLTIAKTSGLQTALDSKQATIADGDLTIAKTDGLQTALDSKQATLTAGTNITIASDGTISASGGGGGGGSGSGIDISGGSTSSDISMNFTGTRNEGDIIYDSSYNIFFEASRSKNDNDPTNHGELDFRPLGYSFFRENMEGQPPSPLFFFFDITPSSITINWTNPRQYPSGVSNLNDTYNDTANGELSATVNSNGNIYFPVVNRIMIQIKNLETGLYITWGGERSPISQSVSGLENGYVICSKNHPIPPMATGVNPSFGTTNSIGRTTKVYELEDMASSIVLYSTGNTPGNDVISTNITSNTKRVSSVNGESNKELNPSTSGYEVKIWLENQYETSRSGGMTEDDFNVITLTTDSSGNALNFQTVNPPSEPIDVSLSLAFNDLASTTVSTGNTVVELMIQDPKETTTSGDFNSSINLVGVKLEYANTDTTTIVESDWTDVKKIYYKNETQITSSGSLGSVVSSGSFVDGLYDINRLNDHSAITDSNTTTKYYYYIKLNSEFLSVTNNALKRYHAFRISYKNASNDNTGITTVSNLISVKQPEKPSITSLVMTAYNKFTITMATYGSDNEDKIIGETTDTDINQNYAVYLREILFRIKYKYESQSDFSEIESFTVSGSNTNYSTGNTDALFVSTESYASNTYEYTIPAGFFENSGGALTGPITYQFESKFKNNLFGAEYSLFSEPITITLTKPNQTSDAITFTILDSTSNKNNTLRASWAHPSDGERGIVSSQSNTTLPKIEKYTFSSTYLKDNGSNTTVDHGITSINNSTRSTDPSITREFTFYDALKYDNTNDSKTIAGGLDLEIKEYNEYINNNSTFSNTISATATKPGEATSLRNDTINILTSTSNNNVTIRWTAPITSSRGLTINSVSRDNTIIQYDLSIDRTTTNKYLSGKITGGSFTTTNYSTTISNGDSTSDKTSTTDATTYLSLTKTLGGNDMFLWPNSTYTFEVKTTNSLGYQTTGVSQSFTTGAPSISSGLDYFNTSRLQTLYTNGSPDKRTDLKNHSSYSNKGVLTSSDITTSTVYSGTAVQITKLFSTTKPSNITSNRIYHILNLTNFQDSTWNNDDATVVSWTDNNPPSDSNQAQFKIFNSGTGSDVEVYTIGTSSNYATDSGVNKDATGIDFAISRNTRQDAYKYDSNYDSRNYGYWYMEGVKYSITFTTGASGTVRAEDLYTPLLYKLKSYYNTNGGDVNVNTNPYGTITILKNSANANSYIYLDDSCTANPTISKYNSSDMINYTTNNKINGITNLHLFNSQTATIALTYTASGYSKRYLLTTASNPLQHYFSYSTSTKKAIVNWSSHTSSAPTLSGNKYERSQNQWNVDGLSITDFPSRTPATIGITLSITATNTHGSTTKTIGSSDSTIYNFISDKPSVDYYNSISSSLREIPSNFNPIYGNSSAQSNTTPSSYVAVGDNTNSLQLSMWNGYFYSNSGWQSTTTITSSNCGRYGLSSSLPVFSGNGTDYKYVIFKYEFTPSSTFSPYKVILSLGDSNNFDVSDLDNNVKIFIYTGESISGADGSSYYWLNISKFSDITDAVASAGSVVYSGGVADSTYETMSNSNFISSSDINGSGKFTNNFSGTVPKRIIGARLNKITISANTTKSIYIAIGCKNSDSLYFKKPDLYLASGLNSYETEQFS